MNKPPSNQFFLASEAELQRLNLAKMLRAGVLFSLFVGVITTILTLFVSSPGWERLQISSILIFGVSVGLWLLLRRGYYHLVAFGMVVGFAGVIVYSAAIGLGVRGTAYAAFPLIVMFASLFIHRRAGYIVAGAATLLGLAFVWANQRGLLANADKPLAEMAVWVNVSTYFFVAAVFLDIVLRYLDHAFQAEAQTKNELHRLNTDLEQHIEKRTRQLAESEARYRLIAENASDIIWTTDLNLILTYISPSVERVRGYTVEEAIRQPINQAFTPSSYEKVINTFAEEMARADGQPTPGYSRVIELEYTRKDGSTCWCEVKVSFLRDEGGNPVGLVGVARDISVRKKAIEALRESEERYRLISTLSSDYAFSTKIHANGELEVDWVTDTFELISGYSFEEYKERGGWLSILHPDSIAQNAWASETLKTKTPVDVEMKIVTKNGDVRWIRFYAHPVWDEANNRLTAIHGAGKDVTIQKQAEAHAQQRREMLEIVIELGKKVTQYIDLQSCLTQIYHSIKNELGFDRVGLMLYDPETNQLQETFTPVQMGEIDDSSWYMRAISEHETWNAVTKTPKGLALIEEFPNPRPTTSNEKTRPMRQHATLAAWAGDKPVALIAVDNAITRRPMTEEKLEALKLFAGYAGLAIENARWNAQLEQRVIERTAELEAANRELQDFTYTIAHDLRAPARAIIGFSRLLQEEQAAILDASGQHYLNRVNYGARRMGQMIDELLAFTRLGRQPLRKELVDMLALVHRVMEEFQPERVERHIEIIIGNLPDEQADSEMVEQVWRNLISNAFKFTKNISDVRIEIGAAEKKGIQQYFVRDNGAGFESSYAHKLFGVFQRLHLEEEFEGTGMGLAIVQRIVQRHGGRVWAEAELNKGAIFYFTLGSRNSI